MHRLVIVSDYVCPYCFVAEEAIKQAVGERKDIVVEFYPYELTRKPAVQVDTYHDEERREKWAKGLVPDAEALGMKVHFPPFVVPRPYTHLAAEGFMYAKEQGKEDAYNEAVFTAYFTKEQDIGRIDVLKQAAEEAGLDGEEFGRKLEEGAYVQQVEVEREWVNDHVKLSGLPTIFLDGRQIKVERYTKAEFERVFAEAEMELEETEEKTDVNTQEEEQQAGGCGATGCFFG